MLVDNSIINQRIIKMEFFIQNKELISEEKYKEIVNSLKPKEELDESINESKIALKLKKLVDDSIKRRIENTDEVGILFSGGLDSSYIAAICKKLKVNFTCYCVGFQDGQFKMPEDIIHAKEVAKFLKLKEDAFKFKIFDLKEIEAIISKTTKILKSSKLNKITALGNVVNVGVGAVEVAGHNISKKEKIFFSGLGSEELFAGYDRHKKNPTNEECFNGLLNMYQRDLLRDVSISSALGFEFRTPFLDEELIKYSLKIPIKFKVNDSESKMIMRKAAVSELDKFSERPKKAAQYGSCFDRAISKLAKNKGYEFKKDYLASL